MQTPLSGAFAGYGEASLSAGDCSHLRANIAAEAVDLQDNIKNFKYFPVVSVGVTIGF